MSDAQYLWCGDGVSKRYQYRVSELWLSVFIPSALITHIMHHFHPAQKTDKIWFRDFFFSAVSGTVALSAG